jgi:nitrite reductase/ring-hydroxylating ferredoxin subunit/uncharacterized membrane protein
MATPSVLHVIEENEMIDRLAEPIHRPVRALLGKSPALRTALDGTWLRHPLHAVLTDIPVGAWTTGFILDLAEVKGFSTKLRKSADIVHTIGLIGAGAAAIAGLADWSYLNDKPRRVGFVHAMLNTFVAGLMGTSLYLRSRKHRGAAIALSTIGVAVMGASAWLGGELSYRYGVGVNHNAFEGPGPETWMGVLDDVDLLEGEMRRVEAEGMAVLITRKDGKLLAIGDTCTHMGCSLAEGRIVGDRVQCRCHGSQFRLSDGKVTIGPATSSVPQFEARVREGRIEIRRGPMNGVVYTHAHEDHNRHLPVMSH